VAIPAAEDDADGRACINRTSVEGGNLATTGAGEAGAEGGGVFRSSACCTTSGGGRAFGEIMMLGACDGSWGRRDQMAHFAMGLTAFPGEGDALRDGAGDVVSVVEMVPICE
jgi:hypothetical protein